VPGLTPSTVEVPCGTPLSLKPHTGFPTERSRNCSEAIGDARALALLVGGVSLVVGVGGTVMAVNKERFTEV